MIYSVQAKSGFAKKLFKRRVFKFKKGLNILVGENGSGKTTLLALAGAYSGVHELKGWTTIPSSIGFEDKELQFPDRFVSFSPAKCNAIVKWDGSPSFGYSADKVANKVISLDEIFHDQLFTDTSQSLKMHINGSASTGQCMISGIAAFLVRLKELPNWTKMPKKVWGPLHGWMYTDKMNSFWRNKITTMIEYVKSLSRTGPMTILMDEPDRSMSLPNQLMMWLDVFPVRAEKFQVIVATHNSLVLDMKNANFIEMNRGYMKQCRNIQLQYKELCK